MTLRASVGMLMLSLATAADGAAETIQLGSGDVYFQYRPAQTHTSIGSRIPGESPRSDRAGLCGFSIRGNHHSKANPRVEWDINIDEVIAGATRIAGVSAGAFDVVGRDRKPRAPIAWLEFQLQGEPQPIPARIVGTPNADNAIKATLDPDAANRLFAAISDADVITITLKYIDGTTHVLQVRGWRELRRFGRGKNSYFNECLRGQTPHPAQTGHCQFEPYCPDTQIEEVPDSKP